MTQVFFFDTSKPSLSSSHYPWLSLLETQIPSPFLYRGRRGYASSPEAGKPILENKPAVTTPRPPTEQSYARVVPNALRFFNGLRRIKSCSKEDPRALTFRELLVEHFSNL
jgi:hypothetical protein